MMWLAAIALSRRIIPFMDLSAVPPLPCRKMNTGNFRALRLTGTRTNQGRSNFFSCDQVCSTVYRPEVIGLDSSFWA